MQHDPGSGNRAQKARARGCSAHGNQFSADRLPELTASTKSARVAYIIAAGNREISADCSRVTEPCAQSEFDAWVALYAKLERETP